MARFREPYDGEEERYEKWLSERPDNVRDVAKRFNAYTLYRLKTTGQRVVLYSFDESDEGVTVTVDVLGRFNLTLDERRVFGISPSRRKYNRPPSTAHE